MPSINSKKRYIFKSIQITYKHDAYDVFTEGIRALIGEVPKSFLLKCDCGIKVKMTKHLFGPSDFIRTCQCGNINATYCCKTDKDYFNISF